MVRRSDLAAVSLRETPRLLLRTGAWKDHSRFPESIPVLDEDVPAFKVRACQEHSVDLFIDNEVRNCWAVERNTEALALYMLPIPE